MEVETGKEFFQRSYLRVVMTVIADKLPLNNEQFPFSGFG